MILSTLSKTSKKGKKRVGRGYGSGKGGHTSGRGAKGRKARGSVPLQFGGTAAGASFYKKLPLLRGKGKLKPNAQKPVAVNVKYLNLLPKNSKVTVDLLIKHAIVDDGAKTVGVKLLGDGEITVPLTVMLPTTPSARKKIEKAGGKVEVSNTNKQKIQMSKSKDSN